MPLIENSTNLAQDLWYDIYGDKMVVYVDLIILATIIVNYAFIKTIAYVAKDKLSPLRVSIGLVISVVSLLMYFLPYKFYFALRYLVGLGIGLIVFSHKDVKIKIIEITVFYFLTMAFIGTLFIFKVKSILIMIVSLLYIIVLYIVQNYQKIFNKNIVILKIGTFKMRALYDSGNLSSYCSYPIVYLNMKFLSSNFKKIDTITIYTISTSKEVDIYLGPPCIYEKKEKQVVYAFLDEFENLSGNDYDAIFNFDTME